MQKRKKNFQPEITITMFLRRSLYFKEHLKSLGAFVFVGGNPTKPKEPLDTWI